MRQHWPSIGDTVLDDKTDGGPLWQDRIFKELYKITQKLFKDNYVKSRKGKAALCELQ